MGELMNSMETALEDMLGESGISNYRYILIGGGGGDVLYDEMCHRLFGLYADINAQGEITGYSSVFRTGEPEKMIMANAEGALDTIMFQIAMAKRRRK